MILADTYEPEDVVFPIVDSVDDKKLKLNIVLAGRFDQDPDIDAELAWALVQNMKDQMTAPAPKPKKIPWSPPQVHYVRNPAGLAISQIPSSEMDSAIIARRRIQEIEGFDQKTWGLWYGAQDVWAMAKSFVLDVSEYVSVLWKGAGLRVRKYARIKLINFAGKLDHARQENRKR